VNSFDAVLFDLDGTLCRQDQDGETIYYGAFERAGIDPFGEPADLWESLEGPPDPNDQVGYLAKGFTIVAAQYGDHPADAEALARGFLDVVDYSAVSFHPGARAAIERARSLGPVGLVTNGPEERQSVKVASLGLTNAFDVVVYAGDMARRKPHPDPFEVAVGSLSVDAAAVLYVGNSLEYDVAGAQGAGLKAAWYVGGRATETESVSSPDPGAYRPDYILESLADLESLLDESTR
jgi:putative hydrolase of the HAD superfamily